MSSKRIPKPDARQQYFWLLFGGVWLAVGAIFLSIAIVAGLREQSLQSAAANAATAHIEGTVLSKSYDPDNSPRSYQAFYRFYLPSGQKIYGSAKVPLAVWETLRELEPVKVHYLLKDPEVHWIDGVERDRLLSYIFGGLGSLLTILGGLILWKLGRQR